jgi:hypothetical protein
MVCFAPSAWPTVQRQSRRLFAAQMGSQRGGFQEGPSACFQFRPHVLLTIYRHFYLVHAST